MSIELERESVAVEAGEYQQYRSLSALAVVSLVLGLISALAFLDWVLGIVPILGLMTGVLALRRIRMSPADYTGELPALAGTLLSGACLIGGWSYLTYDMLTEVPEGYVAISYEELQPDPKAPESLTPPKAKSLDGKKVYVRGFVYQPTTGQTKKLKRFVLVRDKGSCCFGGNPKLNDMILVRMQGRLEARFDMKQRGFGGVFHLQPGPGADGLGGVVYQLDADYLR